jgi:hypothetical protein
MYKMAPENIFDKFAQILLRFVCHPITIFCPSTVAKTGKVQIPEG